MLMMEGLGVGMVADSFCSRCCCWNTRCPLMAGCGAFGFLYGCCRIPVVVLGYFLTRPWFQSIKSSFLSTLVFCIASERVCQ